MDKKVTLKVTPIARQAVNLVRNVFLHLKTQDDAIRFMYGLAQERATMPDLFGGPGAWDCPHEFRRNVAKGNYACQACRIVRVWGELTPAQRVQVCNPEIVKCDACGRPISVSPGKDEPSFRCQWDDCKEEI